MPKLARFAKFSVKRIDAQTKGQYISANLKKLQRNSQKECFDGKQNQVSSYPPDDRQNFIDDA
jgi:hypothetical protein